MTASLRIGVLGVGNVLLGDNGIGPFVLKILESRYEFPPEVVLHDLGSPGLDIPSFFVDYDAIILIGAVSAKGRPGGVRLYRKHQLVRASTPQRVTPYDPVLGGALLFAELGGKCPREVLLVGIIPKTTILGCSLSQAVQAAVVPAISAVLAELHRLGASAKVRPHEAKPSILQTEQVSFESTLGETTHVPGYSG